MLYQFCLFQNTLNLMSCTWPICGSIAYNIHRSSEKFNSSAALSFRLWCCLSRLSVDARMTILHYGNKNKSHWTKSGEQWREGCKASRFIVGPRTNGFIHTNEQQHYHNGVFTFLFWHTNFLVAIFELKLCGQMIFQYSAHLVNHSSTGKQMGTLMFNVLVITWGRKTS